jgi:hypothetical protein
MIKTSSLLLELPVKKPLKKIDAELLKLLNQGLVEARNLMEGLSIDFTQLIKPFLKKPLEKEELTQLCLPHGIVQRMKTAASLLNRQQIDFNLLMNHPSDTVRGWAAYQIASLPNLRLEERLELIKPLADDLHFGVREWAWLALRPFCLSHDASKTNREWVVNLCQEWLQECASPATVYICRRAQRTLRKN